MTKKSRNPKRNTEEKTKKAGVKKAGLRNPSSRLGKTSKNRRSHTVKTKAEKKVPENLMEIAAVILAALGILLILAIYFRSLGPVGRAVDKGLAFLFGVFRYALPLLFFILVPFLIYGRIPPAGEKRSVFRHRLWGLISISLSICGLLHVKVNTLGETWTVRGLCDGGGLAGAAVSWPFRAGMGEAGALVVLSASLLVGALLVTGIRLSLQRKKLSIDEGEEELLEEGEGKPDSETLKKETAEREINAGAGSGAKEDVFATSQKDRPQAGEEAEVPATFKVERSGQISIEIPEIFGGRVYRLPPLELLHRKISGDEKPRKGMERAIAALERTLEQFGVEASLVQVTMGPTVTRFELELGSGVKVNRLLNLAGDIALALGSPDIRIITPIPGKSAVGIEVPNREREVVTLGEVLASPQARKVSSPLKVGLGKDVAGYPVVVDLRDMPHLLMAGATGTGKSSCINSMITSILMHAAPHEVRMLLIDPKFVELNHFNGLPHLLAPVINDPKKAAQALGWVVREMERRYQVLAKAGVKNIAAYSQALREGLREERDEDGRPAFPPMPYILVFIDELADLMMVAPSDVEESIVRIAQMARAVGIHLVVATQRPSVDVVTGIIKANMPSRIAFTVASQADSRVILDQGGAEKLVGKGDMLFLPAGESRPQRIQGSYITEGEITRVTAYIKRQTSPAYEEEIVEEALQDKPKEDRDDELLEEAMETVVRSGMASASLLQRKLRIGYARAARLIDMLEDMGVVGAHEGSKPRAVLMTPEELEERKRRLKGHGNLSL